MFTVSGIARAVSVRSPHFAKSPRLLSVRQVPATRDENAQGTESILVQQSSVANDNQQLNILMHFADKYSVRPVLYAETTVIFFARRNFRTVLEERSAEILFQKSKGRSR